MMMDTDLSITESLAKYSKALKMWSKYIYMLKIFM